MRYLVLNGMALVAVLAMNVACYAESELEPMQTQRGVTSDKGPQKYGAAEAASKSTKKDAEKKECKEKCEKQGDCKKDGTKECKEKCEKQGDCKKDDTKECKEKCEKQGDCKKSGDCENAAKEAKKELEKKAKLAKKELEAKEKQAKKEAKEKQELEKNAKKEPVKLDAKETKDSDKKSETNQKSCSGCGSKVACPPCKEDLLAQSRNELHTEMVTLERTIRTNIAKLTTSGWKQAQADLLASGKNAIPYLIEALAPLETENAEVKSAYNLGSHTKADAARAPRQRNLSDVASEILTSIVTTQSSFKGELPAFDQKAWQEWWTKNAESVSFGK